MATPHRPTLGREVPSRRPRALLDDARSHAPTRRASRQEPYPDIWKAFTDNCLQPTDEAPSYTGDWLQPTVGGVPCTEPEPAAKAAAEPAAAKAKPAKAVVPGAVRGVCAGMYQAMEAAGRFGVIDLGERTRGHVILLLHAPRRNREGIPDLRPGEVITASPMRGHGRETRGAMSLPVGFVTRSRYFRPGALVTSCIIGVPAHAWPFAYATGG
jgi:hypothetical protein